MVGERELQDRKPSGQPHSGYKDLPNPLPTSSSASATMRANRRMDTKPEVLIRSLLHQVGRRFRKDFPILEGHGVIRPDIAFPKSKLAVFVAGCF